MENESMQTRPVEATSYKCPSCNGPLNYDPKTGERYCEFCGTYYSLTEDIPSDAVFLDGKKEFDWSEYNSAYDFKQMENAQAYVCRNCGAEVVATAITAATTCPYCNNNIVLDDRLSGGLQPNSLIPFAIPKEDLSDLLNKFYKKRTFLPKDFFAKNKVEKAQGVYIPFWLFSAREVGDAVFEGTKVSNRQTSKEIITETQVYHLTRSGSLLFSSVPADASRRMDDDVMDSIEPFDYSGLREFKSEYLAGFVAERFDVDPNSLAPRVQERMAKTTLDQFASSCTGYTSVSPLSYDFKLESPAVSYSLLPVYIFNTEYDGKKYRYAINGQTGKVVGEVPSSKTKIAGFFVSLTAIISIAVLAILTFVF